MLDFKKISEDLFNKIKGRFSTVTIGDQDGKVITEPVNARFFDFAYEDEGDKLGKVSVSLNDDNDTGSLVIIYSKDFIQNENELVQSNWYNFLKELRVFAKKRLLNFEVRDITKSNLEKKDYAYLAKRSTGDDNMNESKLYGTSKISYQKIGEARIVIKHTESINQETTTGRTQKIGKIYIESADGERFRYPFKHLSGARAMARHVAEGGNTYDDFGKHIVGLSEEMAKLRKFKNYMGRSAVMAESLSEYMDVVKDRIKTVKKTIESLQKPAYYAETFAAFEIPMMEDVPADVAENWIDQLTIKQFNEELSDVFPYIYKLVSEATKATELGPDDLEEVAGPEDCWDGYKKDGTKPGTGKNKGKRVNNCVKEGTDDYVVEDVESWAKSLDDNTKKQFVAWARPIIKAADINMGDDVYDLLGKEIVNSPFADTYKSWKDAKFKDIFNQLTATEGTDDYEEDDLYIVQKGDTVTDLARQSGTSVGDIIEINGLDDDGAIQAGQQLRVPGINQIGASPATPGATRGINPKDNYSKADFDRLVNQSKYEDQIEQGFEEMMGQFAEGDKTEAFDPKHFDGEFQGYATGDDGEEDEADIEYTATIVNGKPVVHPKSIRVHAYGNNPSSKLGHDVDMDTDMQDPEDMMQQCQDHANELWAKQQQAQGEGNAYAHAVRKAKMNGKKKGDKVDGPDGDEITLEKEQKTPLGEFILSYFDRENGQFPKGETAVLTMVEKDYGEKFIEPAKQFIEKINSKVAEVMGYKETEEPQEFNDIKRLAGL